MAATSEQRRQLRAKRRLSGHCTKCGKHADGYIKCTGCREKGRIRHNKRAKLLKNEVWQIKSVPCTDCKHTYPPEIMEFDHTSGVKLFNISVKVRTKGRSTLLAEIAKCDVRCPTCHRLREFYATNPDRRPT